MTKLKAELPDRIINKFPVKFLENSIKNNREEEENQREREYSYFC